MGKHETDEYYNSDPNPKLQKILGCQLSQSKLFL